MSDSPKSTSVPGWASWLTAPAPGFGFQTVVWFVLSLAVSAYFASEGLRQAFAGQYIVQDDARQHVFWMARFLDSGLFPDDLAANYFQAVAPSGYATLYRAGALIHIDPLLLNKCLPIALGLIATAFCFGLCMRILRVPTAAFIGAVLLNQSMWMQADLISGTPRAFVYPLILAFLFYLARNSRGPCLLVLGLQGLFYPSLVFISMGVLVLRLFDWRERKLRFSRTRSDYIVCAVGLAISAALLVIYALKSSGFGPVVTAAEARSMPEFSSTGRIRVFHEGFWEYWVSGQNTGIAPLSALLPLTICAGFLLPLVLRRREWFPLAKRITENAKLLSQFALASAFMFVAAHLLLFRLYLPNRYSEHSLRIILSVSAGATLIVILDGALNMAGKHSAAMRGAMAPCLWIAIALILILYPGSPRRFMQTNYRPGRDPALYEFFSNQPKSVLIASLARDADRIPIFAKRSNLVSWEYILPFHKNYYSRMRERTIDLIEAQYTSDLDALKDFIRKYHVDFIVLDRRAFVSDYVRNDRFIRLFQPAAANAAAGLDRGIRPAAMTLMQECSVLQTEDHVVLASDCILSALRD